MSKPMGPIPEEFAKSGMLRVGGRGVGELVAEAGGTPLFAYDLGIIDARVARFRAVFPYVDLHYAMKANPYAEVLAHCGKLTDGLDVASAGEMQHALSSGVSPEHISFAGPGKTRTELEDAVRAGVTLNCESEGEADRTLAIAAQIGVRPRIAVRVNPDFEIKGSGMRMGGGAKPFGIDAERVPALTRRLIDAGADWRGYHIFAGSQALSAEALVESQKATLALAVELAEKTQVSPPLVNLGGGFGIPHFGGETPLDVEAVGRSLAQALDSRAEVLRDTRFAIELGRWLVGECGVYLTRIVDRKVSHGKTFLIVDGGMHHQLAASGNFGQIVRRNYPVAVADRMGDEPEEEVSVVGCLCTPLDRLADDVMLPHAGEGDLIAVFLAGAYGLSASPQAFLGHEPAREIAVPPTA